MSTAAKRTFSCPKCGARFPWQDAYVNKRVGCKCGEVFQAFEDVPDDARVDAYDVADDEDAGRRPVAPASTVAAPVAATRQSATAPLTAYPVKVRQAVQDDQGVDDAAPFRNLVLPALLLLAGVGIAFAHAILDPREDKSIAFSVVYNALFLGIMTVVMLAGGAIAAGLMGVNFGAVGRCALKFAGTAMFTGAIAIAAGTYVDGIMVVPVVVILYWICFQMLFDLDVQESMMTVAIVTLMQTLATFVLMRLG